MLGDLKDHEEADEHQDSSAYIGLCTCNTQQQEEPLPVAQGGVIQNHPIRAPPGRIVWGSRKGDPVG
jgi:hypothetical protein